ncbi:tyrosine-type recombinase/integrase [Zobellia alginiliquefaciens]|uniref:tyrosine-type recombinase/integrase n=1 Tax=Zobellia alginiliquefaciens TaxID=3032586 RepID=UPI0023E170F1|nr:site-specific integrase [Zobellia alginiliquefaciens]
MPTISVVLQTVNETVYTFPMKPNFTEPKIYTGGVDVRQWSKLSKTEQKKALKKPWYVYFSFRDPKTGKLKRQAGIKGGANRYTTKRDRLSFLKVLQAKLLFLLKEGFDPYQKNTELENKFKKRKVSTADNKPEAPQEFRATQTLSQTTVPETPTELIKKDHTETDKTPQKPNKEKESIEEPLISVAEAFELALKIKKSILNQNSYPKYRSRINRFQKWLDENDYDVSDIRKIDRKTVISYLNDVLQQTSPRNRNNTRAALSSLFSTLEENELIGENFILKINVLRSVPERNKTYTPHQLKEIDSYLKTNDPLLRLFVQFVSYNFLRPIEICRLKIGDVDIQDKKIYVRAKNKVVKIKIIPDIMINNIPDISDMNKEHYLFTPERIGGEWETDESNKRDYFSKRFKKVKDHFKLGKDYGLYSFRHSFITGLYREMAKTATSEEVKSRLMLITGHTSPQALEKYLRDIDAALPEDYSNLIKPKDNNDTP